MLSQPLLPVTVHPFHARKRRLPEHMVPGDSGRTSKSKEQSWASTAGDDGVLGALTSARRILQASKHELRQGSAPVGRKMPVKPCGNLEGSTLP